MSLLPPIEQTKLVTDAFGYFPTFHDAEIVSLHLERGKADFGTPLLEFSVHCWETTSEKTKEGYFKQEKNHLISFRFTGVDAVKLDSWNHQNVLFELVISKISKPKGNALIKVELSSSFGLEGSFTAMSGEVFSCIPCDEHGCRR